jgi:hypothetical protein
VFRKQPIRCVLLAYFCCNGSLDVRDTTQHDGPYAVPAVKSAGKLNEQRICASLHRASDSIFINKSIRSALQGGGGFRCEEYFSATPPYSPIRR